MVLAAGTNDKFANAVRGISSAIGILRGKAFVIMVVAADNHVGVGIVECLEERLHSEVVAVGAARTEERFVPIGQLARGRMGGEIGAQPFFLGRTGFTAADILAFAIQHNDVPGSQFVAVVAGLWVTGGGAKIVEVRGGAGSMKFVIAGGRPGTGFCATPSLVVTDEILLAAIRIGEVADSHDGAGELVEELGGGFGAGKILTIGDVASTDENRRLIVGRECARGNCGVEGKTKKGSGGENRNRQCGFQVNLAVRIKFLAEIQAAEKAAPFKGSF